MLNKIVGNLLVDNNNSKSIKTNFHIPKNEMIKTIKNFK